MAYNLGDRLLDTGEISLDQNEMMRHCMSILRAKRRFHHTIRCRFLEV